MSSFLSYGFLTPPAIFISLCLLGTWLALYRAPLGLIIALVASLCLYATSMPIVASYLLQRIEAKIPLGSDFAQAQAIVVLGGGVRRGHGDDKDSLDIYSVERVALAARAYRRLHLPVAVAGGRVHGAHDSEAGLMRAALDTDYAVPVTWTEDRSETTYENALYAQRLLQPAGIDTVIVVTQAWHMPRALWSFERVGLHPLPWPAPRDYMHGDRLDDFLPSVGALHDSYLAFHELLGSAYYRLHY